jgi:hypothetical protein
MRVLGGMRSYGGDAAALVSNTRRLLSTRSLLQAHNTLLYRPQHTAQPLTHTNTTCLTHLDNTALSATTSA